MPPATEPMTKADATRFAQRIAEALFVNGAGEEAERLVLTIDGDPPCDLGGLCKRVVVDRVVAILLSRNVGERNHSRAARH